MKFIVEIPDEEIRECVYLKHESDAVEGAREEIQDAIDCDTGFIDVRVTVFNNGGATELVNDGLLAAIEEARATIKALHGAQGWDIYNRCSPEMKLINAAIARAKAVTA